MKIIPVIDIQRGRVVRAIRGERNRYRPLQSCLCNSNDPKYVMQALINFYPFDTIYIADLDAIIGQSDNTQIITELCNQDKTPQLWVDRGISSLQELQAAPIYKQQHVIGSETGINPQIFRKLKNLYPDIILSLDFLSNKLIGNEELLNETDIWPEKVIVMALDRVGSSDGPDYERTRKIKTATHKHKIYASGGVSHQEDIKKLQDIGISGVLLSTVLHNGHISAEFIDHIHKKNAPQKRSIKN